MVNVNLLEKFEGEVAEVAVTAADDEGMPGQTESPGAEKRLISPIRAPSGRTIP